MATRRDPPRPARSATGSSAESPPTVFPPAEEAKRAAARRASAESTSERPARAAPTPEAASQARSGAASKAGGIGVSNEARYEMIAQAAYLRAERRGFEPGGEVEDWLAAEAEVDRLLAARHAPTPQ